MCILKKTLKPVVSVMSDGFACLYFLMIFLLCTAVITTAMTIQENRLKTEINVQKADQLAMEEAAVLSYIKCALQNDHLEEGSFEENGVSFSIRQTAHGATVSIGSPYAEILDITFSSDNQHVYDYDVIRSEEPA